MASEQPRPPFPPFTQKTAIQKVRGAEDGWNSRDPERVSLAYTPKSRWRNRSEFLVGREEIVAFLTRKWAAELEYRLNKELYRLSTETASQSALRTSSKMQPASGFAPTGTKIGSSTSWD